MNSLVLCGAIVPHLEAGGCTGAVGLCIPGAPKDGLSCKRLGLFLNGERLALVGLSICSCPHILFLRAILFYHI